MSSSAPSNEAPPTAPPASETPAEAGAKAPPADVVPNNIPATGATGMETDKPIDPFELQQQTMGALKKLESENEKYKSELEKFRAQAAEAEAAKQAEEAQKKAAEDAAREAEQKSMIAKRRAAIEAQFEKIMANARTQMSAEQVKGLQDKRKALLEANEDPARADEVAERATWLGVAEVCSAAGAATRDAQQQEEMQQTMAKVNQILKRPPMSSLESSGGEPLVKRSAPAENKPIDTGVHKASAFDIFGDSNRPAAKVTPAGASEVVPAAVPEQVISASDPAFLSKAFDEYVGQHNAIPSMMELCRGGTRAIRSHKASATTGEQVEVIEYVPRLSQPIDPTLVTMKHLDPANFQKIVDGINAAVAPGGTRPSQDKIEEMTELGAMSKPQNEHEESVPTRCLPFDGPRPQDGWLTINTGYGAQNYMQQRRY